MSPERTALVIALLALVACGDGFSRPVTELAIDTLADGSVRVSNPPHGLWDARPEARWRLVETLRIGSLVADAPDAFGDVASFTLDGLGRFWIGDYEARDVRVFDADGRFVRVVGGPGEGPGEFGRIGTVGTGPDGHIWVSDSDKGRFEVFDTAGNRLDGYRMPGRFGGFWRGGDFFEPFYAGDSDKRMYRIHRLGASGSLEPDGRVFELPEPPPEPPMIEYSDGTSAWHLPAPYTPSHDWQIGRNLDYWWSDGSDLGGRYEIRHVDFASGRTLRTIVRHYEPVAISDAARIAAVEAVLESVRTDRGLGSARRPSDRAMRVVPRVLPPFRSFHVAADGSLWVRRHLAEGVTGFDVFDGDGRLLGQPELPAGFGSTRVRWVTADRMYAIDTDELGVDYVVRLEIVRPGEEG